MKKNILLRMYNGFAITLIVNLLLYLVILHLKGSVVTPTFRECFRSEIVAALWQLLLVGLIGAGFAGAAAIFEIQQWSFLKQGLVHFVVTAAVWVPVMCICWLPFTRKGMVLSSLGWTFTYAVNWLIQYLIYRSRVRSLNRRIAECRAKEGRA